MILPQKCSHNEDSLTRSAARMNSELEELAMEYERTHAAACITEKRGKNFE